MDQAQAFEIVDNFVRELVFKMENHIFEKYGFKIKIKVNTSASTYLRVSKGGIRHGTGWNKILCNRYIHAIMNNELINETEYAHINDDPVIGGLKNVSWRQACASLVAHEVAHVVQFEPTVKTAAKNTFNCMNDISGHGKFWQSIYADLRRNFVNDASLFENQKNQVIGCTNKKKQTEWYTKEIMKNGGRHVYYYRTDNNEMIGHLFRRPGQLVQMKNPKTTMWEVTDFTSIVKARKHFFKI